MSAFALAAVLGGASHAFASGVIDPDPSPSRTGITTAAVAPTNTIGISKTAAAQPGDVVAVNVYYHNSGNQTINNLTIKISPSSTGTGTSHTFTGTITGDGVSSVSDNAFVNVSSSQKLTFIPGSVQWFPNQTTTPQSVSAAQEAQFVGGSGINIGALTAGWSSQGGIQAFFQVSDSTVTPNCPSGQHLQNNVCVPDVITGQAPTVSTDNYSGFDSANGNITLKGYVNSNNTATATYFQYRVNNGAWMNTPSVNRGIVNGTSFSQNLTNLTPGNYEYQAVATSSFPTVYGISYYFTIGNVITTQCPSGTYGTYPNCIQNPVQCPSGYYVSGNTCIQNVQNCPSGYYLSGNTCIQNIQQQNSAPTVSTLGTISVGSTVAAVDGYYTTNGCSAYTSFKYGTTQSLGNTTGEVLRNSGSGSMAQPLLGLSQNTTYWYQASIRNCVGTSEGGLRSFTTGTDTTRDTTIIRYVNTNTNTTTGTGTGTGGGSIIKLMIDNHRETVRSGSEISYDVSWENLTTRTLNKLVLEVNFPTQMAVLDTDRGLIERNKNAVIYQIDTLGSREKGTMVITTRIEGSLRDNDPVVAQAIMVFENPKTSATENAIAYDADQFSLNNSVLGASIFGLDFLPSSLAGWLIILLIILLIIILAHAYMVRHRTATTVVNNQIPPHVQNIPMEVVNQAGAQANDYVVYRPTPKQ